MNEKAVDAFIVNIARINEHLAAIQEHVADHMGRNSDAIHWGDVGDADRVLELLKQVTEFLWLDVTDVTSGE